MNRAMTQNKSLSLRKTKLVMSKKIEIPQLLLSNGSVAKQIADFLTQDIISHKYQIGDFIPTEEELCLQYGIGRSSVREAIKTLESRGLVRKMQGKGGVVIDETIEATSQMLKMTLDMNNVSLRDLVDFRVSMEVQLAKTAALRATEDDIARIKEILDLMSGDNYSYEDFTTHDYLFHEAIIEASGNNIAALMIKALRPVISKQIEQSLKSDFNQHRIYEFHHNIYEKIKGREVNAAGRAMSEHLNETYLTIEALK